MIRKNKNIISFLCCLLSTLSLFASGVSTTGITLFSDLIAEVGGWLYTANSIMEYFVAFFAVGGGFLIFFQFIQGNDQAPKNLIKLIIGIVFFVLAFSLISVFLPGLPAPPP